MNFNELMKMVPSTGTAELPKINKLPKADVLITKDMGDGVITVYANGLYTYVEEERTEKGMKKRTTVYAVDRAASEPDPVDPSKKTIPYKELSKMEWYYPLWMMGMSRIEKNINRGEEEHIAFSLNNDGSDYSVYDEAYDFAEEEEIAEYEEKMDARKEVLAEVMGKLSDAQRECINESFYSNKTKTDIAKERGCSQQAVSKNIDAGLKKARKAYEKLGIK